MKKPLLAFAAIALVQACPGFAQELSFTDDFSDGVLSDSRYRVRTSNENSTVIVDNGMLRLEANGTGDSPGRAALDLIDQTAFLQADLKLDATSMAEGTGQSRVMLAGTLYNDRKNQGVEGEGSLGDVLVQLSLRLRGDGTLDSQFCAFRSNDADFGEIDTIAIDGFTECGRFDTEIRLGVPYTASIYIDRVDRKLVFKLDGETLEHSVKGNIFDPTTTSVSSVLAQANGTGVAVAFADNVSTSLSGPTEDEETDDTTDDTTDDGTDATTDDTTDDGTDATTDDTTDDTTDATTGDTTDVTTDDANGDTTEGDAADTDTTTGVPADDGTIVGGNSGGSSSGCSIAGSNGMYDPMLAALAGIAVLVLGLRRRVGRRSVLTDSSCA